MIPFIPLESPFLSGPPLYYINGVTVDVGGETLKPNDSIFVSWGVSGVPGYESCFVSVRPIVDLKNDDAWVAQVYPHPQCGGSSTSIQIPMESHNESFPFDGSKFIVRVNAGNGIYADSATFKIQDGYTPPWQWTEIIALVNVILTICIFVATAYYTWKFHSQDYRLKKLEAPVAEAVRRQRQKLADAENAAMGAGILQDPPAPRQVQGTSPPSMSPHRNLTGTSELKRNLPMKPPPTKAQSTSQDAPSTVSPTGETSESPVISTSPSAAATANEPLGQPSQSVVD